LAGSQELLRSEGVFVSAEQLAIATGLRGGGKVAIFLAIQGSLCAVIGISIRVRIRIRVRVRVRALYLQL
jgi:hypothetical protein